MHVLRYGIGCFRQIFRHCEGKILKTFWLASLARIINTPAEINTPVAILLRVRRINTPAAILSRVRIINTPLDTVLT